MKFNFIGLLILIGILSASVFGQKIHWKRETPLTTPDLQLFHSQHVVNLPTAETLQKNDFEFEISHRFIHSINDGSKYLFGLDGPGVWMRLALGYAITDKMFVTLGRSNAYDNLDLKLKWKFLEFKNDNFPLVAALQVGAAQVMEVYDPTVDNHQNQFFGQFVLNTLIAEKLGIGVVPTYVSNSTAFVNNDKDNSFTVGVYSQYYVSHILSILAEWNPTISGYKGGEYGVAYTPFTFGIELETGGHFFKIFATNSALINTTQFVTGGDLKNKWRLGFMITRLLKFF